LEQAEVEAEDASSDIAASGVEGDMGEDFHITHEIGGSTFAEVDARVQHIPSVLTFAGVPAAMDGDLVYLGGGLYANAGSPAKAREAPKRAERTRVLPGRVRPGKWAAVSGCSVRTGRSSSQPPPTQQPQRDEYGFVLPGTESDLAAAAPVKTAPPAWRPGGVSKRPPAALVEPSSSTQHCRSESGDDQMLLMAEGSLMRRKAPEACPGNSEARARDRDDARRAGSCGLFGRQGMLREIAEMQAMPQVSLVMPLPSNNKPRLPVGVSNSDLRAVERKMAKEARVQALLEERAEHDKAAAELTYERAGRMTRGLAAAASAPLLPAPGSSFGSLGMGMLAPTGGDEIEKQKLRVACKMETLSFLNGYTNAVGKMSLQQKAELLATLHSSKSAKPKMAPCARTSPGKPHAAAAAAEEESEWWPQQEEEPSIHQRLQHVNDVCNQAFDFEL